MTNNRERNNIDRQRERKINRQSVTRFVIEKMEKEAKREKTNICVHVITQFYSKIKEHKV